MRILFVILVSVLLVWAPSVAFARGGALWQVPSTSQDKKKDSNGGSVHQKGKKKGSRSGDVSRWATGTKRFLVKQSLSL